MIACTAVNKKIDGTDEVIQSQGWEQIPMAAGPTWPEKAKLSLAPKTREEHRKIDGH